MYCVYVFISDCSKFYDIFIDVYYKWKFSCDNFICIRNVKCNIRVDCRNEWEVWF